MTITAEIEINNLPELDRKGYEVVTNDGGTLWHYGFYVDADRAKAAVEEHTDRFMIQIG